MIRNKIISIDFDGTCTTKNKFPKIGYIQPYLKECISMLQENGNICILNTCREGGLLNEAVEFLKYHGIVFDYINENPKHKIEMYGDCRKIGADFYIDDKNIFSKIDWEEIMIYFKYWEEE